MTVDLQLTSAHWDSMSSIVLVDSMDDLAERTYGAWPERIYVLDKSGAISYQGGKGPYGFNTAEVDQFLAESSQPSDNDEVR